LPGKSQKRETMGRDPGLPDRRQKGGTHAASKQKKKKRQELRTGAKPRKKGRTQRHSASGKKLQTERHHQSSKGKPFLSVSLPTAGAEQQVARGTGEGRTREKQEGKANVGKKKGCLKKRGCGLANLFVTQEQQKPKPKKEKEPATKKQNGEVIRHNKNGGGGERKILERTGGRRSAVSSRLKSSPIHLKMTGKTKRDGPSGQVDLGIRVPEQRLWGKETGRDGPQKKCGERGVRRGLGALFPRSKRRRWETAPENSGAEHKGSCWTG